MSTVVIKGPPPNLMTFIPCPSRTFLKQLVILLIDKLSYELRYNSIHIHLYI